MKILVTGSAGFIGSAFIRRVLGTTDHSIRAFTHHTSERNLLRLTLDNNFQTERKRGGVELIYGDLSDTLGLCEGVDAVVHFAARTFVDQSILDPRPFIESNVIGTFNLLEDVRRYDVKKYIQVGTDEVYGSILEGAYTEDAPLNPTNPYSASKAAGDTLAISYAHTYGLNTVITRTENNYGPWQHPQKVFPTFVRKLLAGQKLPLYGDGKHVRQWLWVDDHVDALLHLLQTPTSPGSIYHIAGAQELENLELARRIIIAMREEKGPLEMKTTEWGDEWASLIEFVPDEKIRPGHDRRYALDSTKLRATGWEPKVSLDTGIEKAVSWYLENPWWLQ